MWHSNLWAWTILIYLLLRRRGDNAPWVFMTVDDLVLVTTLVPHLDQR